MAFSCEIYSNNLYYSFTTLKNHLYSVDNLCHNLVLIQINLKEFVNIFMTEYALFIFSIVIL